MIGVVVTRTPHGLYPIIFSCIIFRSITPFHSCSWRLTNGYALTYATKGGECMAVKRKKFLCKACITMKWKSEMDNPKAAVPGICKECADVRRQERRDAQRVQRPASRNRSPRQSTSVARRFTLWGVSEEHREMLRLCARRFHVTMPEAAETAFSLLYQQTFNSEERTVLAARDRVLRAYVTPTQTTTDLPQ